MHLFIPLLNVLFRTVILMICTCFSIQSFSQQQSPAVNPTEKSVNKNDEHLVRFKTKKDLLLGGYYFSGANNSSGVIVLHDCASGSKNYMALAKKLADQGLHTLLMDLRGYGESMSSKYSQQDLKNQAKSIVEYQSALTLLTFYWEDDVLAAYHFLRSKVDNNKEIAIVSAGCSAPYAVSLAEKIHLNSLVMITPMMSYADKERYKNLIDIPTYFISSSHHHETFQTAKELFEWNGSNRSKIQLFKGNRYNSALLRGKQYLSDDIALWLKSNLE